MHSALIIPKKPGSLKVLGKPSTNYIELIMTLGPRGVIAESLHWSWPTIAPRPTASPLRHLERASKKPRSIHKNFILKMIEGGGCHAASSVRMLLDWISYADSVYLVLARDEDRRRQRARSERNVVQCLLSFYQLKISLHPTIILINSILSAQNFIFTIIADLF